MHMYGCELWNLSSTYTDKLIAWRKIKRLIWKIPINSHTQKRILKFIHNGLNSNSVCANLLQVKLTCNYMIIIDFYHTHVTLAVLIGQMI